MILTREQLRFLQRMLGKVSRSFALVIPLLDEPLRHYLATAYLLCRVVDNIEDCTNPPAWKDNRFDEFQELLVHPEKAALVLQRWEQEAWPGLIADEVALMSTAGLPLWQIYAMIPSPQQASISHWTSEMATGMRLAENNVSSNMYVDHNGVRVLNQESDYNDYCYYVAGTVGHMASEMAVMQYGLNDNLADKLYGLSTTCGRGLQKTNIVKDFAKDLGRGVSYLPHSWHGEADYSALRLAGALPSWTRKVILDVVNELRKASGYVTALPYHSSGYRMACLMSLIPAFQTLLLAAEKHLELFTPQHQVKISRLTMMKCQKDAKSLLDDNDRIQEYAERLTREIELALV